MLKNHKLARSVQKLFVLLYETLKVLSLSEKEKKIKQ